MGNPKQKWTSEEEEALRAGIKKHGTGKWKNIQRDPEFTALLSSRSNIDLKDKWRNLTVSASNGSIPRDKWKTKLKVISDASVSPMALTVPSTQAPPPPPTLTVATPIQAVSMDVCVDDTSSSKVDVKTASKYDAMIYEALSNIKDPTGADTSTIVSFIEQKHDVAPNFRRLVGSRLRRLVAQGKLEKVDSSYRTKSAKSPVPQPTNDPVPQQIQSPEFGDTPEEASVMAASCIADIENKTFVAAEAVKEAERVSRMAEDAMAFLDFADDLFERSSAGGIVLRV